MTKTNTWRNIVIIGGGIVSLVLVIFNLYHAFRASAGVPPMEGLVPELFSAFVVAVIFLLPAFALWSKKNTGRLVTKVGILYPALVLLAFINILMVDEPVAAGLPMLLVAVLFCVVYGLVVLVRKG